MKETITEYISRLIEVISFIMILLFNLIQYLLGGIIISLLIAIWFVTELPLMIITLGMYKYGICNNAISKISDLFLTTSFL